jgi:hypothetical protein
MSNRWTRREGVAGLARKGQVARAARGRPADDLCKVGRYCDPSGIRGSIEIALRIDLFIRLGVSLTGLAILLQAARLRHYTFVAIFAAIFVVYNPVVAVFPLSGTEAFNIVVATTLPFAASLIWLRPARLPDSKAAPSSDASRVFFSSAKSSAL